MRLEFGPGTRAGLSIVFLAIRLDRICQGAVPKARLSTRSSRPAVDTRTNRATRRIATTLTLRGAVIALVPL